MPAGDSRRYTRTLKREYWPRLNQFRKLLIQARRDSGLSQIAVALMLGRPQSYVSKIEKAGKTGKVDFVLMERLAAIYGKPLSFFSTLPSDVREGDKYLGLTNAEWEHQARELRPAIRKRLTSSHPTIGIDYRGGPHTKPWRER